MCSSASSRPRSSAPSSICRRGTAATEWRSEGDDDYRHSCEHGLTHCTICDYNPAVKTGLFVPTESFARRIGQPKDKCRIVIYVIRKRCAEDPDEAARRVEEPVLRECGAQ